jgi:lipoprotein-anchoring transpeptidase ErfK/SrfK
MTVMTAALALVPVLAGCGGSSGAVSSKARTVTVVVHHGSGHSAHTASHATATDAAASSARTSGETDPTPPAHRASPRAQPTTVAIVRRGVPLRSAPGGRGRVLGRLTPKTQFGSVTAVPVVQRRGGWLGVTALPAGNGHTGWVPRSAVSLTRTGWRIYVSISRQQITVSYGGEIVKRLRTSTGVPGAATPTGHFAVTDRLRTGVEHGPYGCCILALSAVQPLHLSDWDGGNRIAIHATDAVAELGRPASHGCAHVDDADGHWLLAHIPDGTPVVIEDPPYHPGRGSPA